MRNVLKMVKKLVTIVYWEIDTDEEGKMVQKEVTVVYWEIDTDEQGKMVQKV